MVPYPVFFKGLDYADDLDLDLVTGFFYFHVDLLVIIRDLVHAIFTGCNNSLEFCHISPGHPPEIIIYKNNCCHEFSPRVSRKRGYRE